MLRIRELVRVTQAKQLKGSAVDNRHIKEMALAKYGSKKEGEF